jgi:hypothetical protein
MCQITAALDSDNVRAYSIPLNRSDKVLRKDETKVGSYLVKHSF